MQEKFGFTPPFLIKSLSRFNQAALRADFASSAYGAGEAKSGLRQGLQIPLPAGRDLRRLIIQVVFLLLDFCLLAAPCLAQPAKYVRVAVIEDAPSLSLKLGGFYEIVDSASHKVLARGKNLKTTVIAYKDGFMAGGKNFSAPRILIKANDAETFVINERRFRGDIQLIKKKNGHILAVNHIELDDYVKGISVRELSPYWPQEALKAGVIIFRTFALYKIQENYGRDYDLTSDIYSQVYSGRAAERYRVNKAVDDTKNLILTYKGRILPAFYHANCSGHTEDASILWNIDIAPLKGVPCSFCKDSPHFKWHYVLAQDEIKKKLAGAGYSLKSIKEIKISGRDGSGRITNLNITGEGKDINISAKDFRNILGPNIIKSTNFNVAIAKDDAVFEGLGWGHGAGLCQWGAYFMAKQGARYKQVLQYYYPQSNVETIKF